MLANKRDCFLFIARLTDYELDEIPIGAILLRDKNDFSDRRYSDGHAASYIGMTSEGPMTYMAVGPSNGIKAVLYEGQFTYVAWPKGLAASRSTVKKVSQASRIVPRRVIVPRNGMQLLPY